MESLSDDQARRLIYSLLLTFRDWPEDRTQPIRWPELTERLSAPSRHSPDALRRALYQCKHEGFLSAFSAEGDTFRVGHLTPLGLRMLQDEYALARRDYWRYYGLRGLFGAILIVLWLLKWFAQR
ncbi:MAG: hypothetical protein GXX99_06795 [Clostridiales bacterium]|nr:hypothetical protein [Clostridiales bacterium]